MSVGKEKMDNDRVNKRSYVVHKSEKIFHCVICGKKWERDTYRKAVCPSCLKPYYYDGNIGISFQPWQIALIRKALKEGK